MEKQKILFMKKSTASSVNPGTNASKSNARFKAVKATGPHSRISDKPRKSSTGGLNHSIGSKKGK